MADTERPSTPPHRAAAPVRNPITPEQVRRMEESRLRAKALRTQQEAAASSRLTRQQSSSATKDISQLAGQKRAHAAISNAKDIPSTSRDARSTIKPSSGSNSNNGLAQPLDTDIRAARKFQKFVEYDFSKMNDTKGGFMTLEDDPHNRALHAGEDGKPTNMSLKEWEHIQLQRKLQKQRAGKYEPGLSVLASEAAAKKKCRECKTLEIDWAWEEMLHCYVCHSCKDKFPDKYSLLTKSEAREDYLLTDPELKDTDLLPHLERPNPHKASFAPMMLYLRYQIEEYAFSDQKWGSPEALDAEFERRKVEAKERKEKKFRNKLDDLKKRTRVEAYRRARGGGGGEFGDTIGKGKHEHEWGRSVEDPKTGMMRKKCVECGMQVEEMEF